MARAHENILTLLVICICSQVCFGTMTGWLKLLQYQSPTDAESSGDCQGECQVVFSICLDHPDSSNMDMYTCPMGWYDTGRVDDMNDIIFGDSIGGVQNPHVFTGTEWPGGVLLKVRVYDQGSMIQTTKDSLLKVIRVPLGDDLRQFSLGDDARLTVAVNASCGPDYYGPNCTAFCAPDENDHYSCDDVTGEKICHPDYYGPRCIQYCSTTTSYGEAHYSCDPTTGSRICHQGWSGYTCGIQLVIDRCDSSPCQNGGTCITDLENDTYSCVCAGKWIGSICDEVESCSADPCQGRGYCENRATGFHCFCNDGWDGLRCEEEIHLCEDQPCLNGATCTESRNENVAEYQCQCTEAWEGTDCHIDKDECNTNPCPAAQECQNTYGSYYCHCSNGGTGETCQVSTTTESYITALDPCRDHLCQNSAICNASQDVYTCICPEGFLGVFCERTDYCVPNPCAHDQACVQTDDGFMCQCDEKYTGSTCSQLITTPGMTSEQDTTSSSIPSTPRVTEVLISSRCVDIEVTDIVVKETTSSPTSALKEMAPDLIDETTLVPTPEPKSATSAPTPEPKDATLAPTQLPKGSDERPHWLYAVPRSWMKETNKMEAELHWSAHTYLSVFSKDVTAQIVLWRCEHYEKSDTYQLMSVLIRARGHIQSEEKTLEVIERATGSDDIEVLVGNETAPCLPIMAAARAPAAVLSSRIDRQELLYVTGALLFLMTVALIIAAIILIRRKRSSRGVFVPSTEVAPCPKEVEAKRKLVVLRKKDLTLDVERANRRNTNRDSRIQDDFVPQCFVNLVYDDLLVPPITPEDNPPTSSPRPLSIYKKFHYEA